MRQRLVPVGVVLFGLGLAAVITVFVLFAGGARDLPWWLSAAAMLLPVGLALAVAGAIR